MKKIKIPENPALRQELPQRLTELETELRKHPTRKAEDRPLHALELEDVQIGKESATQFSVGKKAYAAGHSDITYAGSNHARGVRHIRFYAEGQVVLDIEGDFEDQQLGTNFRFKNIDIYHPGEWETDLIKVTDGLRNHAAKRRQAFSKKRAAEHARTRF